MAGDLTCVMSQYAALQGKDRIPRWLEDFRNAFALANRRAGRCEEVARTIHHALRKLGERPEYLRVSVEGRPKLLGFDEVVNGSLVKNYQVAETGYHVAVKWGDKIIDAYTGPMGLPLEEYLKRLVTHPTAQKVPIIVQDLLEAP